MAEQPMTNQYDDVKCADCGEYGHRAIDCPHPGELTRARAEIERLRVALNDAAYALFQIKRMVPEAIVEHSKQAYAKACAVLNRDADEPEPKT